VLTLLLIDQEVHIGVNGDDYHVGQDVSATNKHQRLGVLHGNSFRHLHHAKYDHQIGTVNKLVKAAIARGNEGSASYI
jgi:hypothetical protein